jgi:hypothetical protein
VSQDNVRDINSKVDLDLDAEEAKLPTRPDYFVTRRGLITDPQTGEETQGTKRIRFTDPNKVDWRILATLNDNAELIGHIVPDAEDKAFLRSNPIGIELLLRLLEKLKDHFKSLPELGGGKQLPL